jgi:hypothetical protein
VVALKSDRLPKSNSTVKLFLASIVLLAALNFLHSPSSFALDEGGGTAGISYRSIGQETYLTDTKEYEAVYHLDLWQTVPNIGRLMLYLDWTDSKNAEHENKLGTGYLALEGFRYNDFLLNGLAGDSFIPFTNFGDRFANVVYPDIYFRGGRADLFSPQGEVHFFGGKVATLTGLLGNIYDTTDETLYGFKGGYRITPNLLLGTGFIRTEDEVGPAGRPVTESNNIFLLDAEWQTFSWMKWLAEFRQSNFEGAPGVEDHKDYAWLVGPILRGRAFKFEANYRRVGTYFHSVSEATQGFRDQEGLFLLGEYRPSMEVTLFGNFDRYHNNVSDQSDRNTLDTTHPLIGFSFFNPKYPSLFLTYDVIDQKTRSSIPNPIDNQTATLSSEIRYQYRDWNPYFRYRRVDYQDEVSRASEYVQNVGTLGLRKDLWAGTFIYGEGEVDRKKYEDHGEDSRVSGKLGVNVFTSSAFSCWGEVIYSQLKERTEDTRRDRIDGAIGMDWQLPWDMRIYADVRYVRNFDLPRDTLKSENFQVTFQIGKKFGWGMPERTAGLKFGEETRGFGTVEGYVFNDINRNGSQDKGEEGVKGVTLLLEDRSTVVTDENGYYQFPRVEVGGHMVTLDTRRIPAEYSIISPQSERIDVRLRQSVKVNFELIAVGRIEGRVINDANLNGKLDPSEKGVPDVLLVVEPGDNNTYTDEEGKFILENILPGKYRMRLDPVTLPEGATSTTPLELNFEVPVGGEVKDLDFLIFVKPRVIIIGPPKAP